MMLIGSLALAGIRSLPGFYSKDVIMEAAWAAGTPIGDVRLRAAARRAFMTAFYSWRQLLMTFMASRGGREACMGMVTGSSWIVTVAR